MKMVFIAAKFPKKGQVAREGYCINVYKTVEEVTAPDGRVLKDVTCRGNFLPNSPGVIYDFQGDWENTQRGYQLKITSYEVVLLPEKSSIIAYLSSLKGVGPSTANKIFLKFGVDTIDVLDKTPERLTEIQGISEKKMMKIRDSYLEQRDAKDIITFLVPYGVPAKRAIKMYKDYGSNTLNIVKTDPYKIAADGYLSFPIVDAIADKMKFDKAAPERIEQAIVYTLQCAANAGHTCLPGRILVERTLRLLETNSVTEKDVRRAGVRLIDRAILFCFNKLVYLKKHYIAENRLAVHLLSQKNGATYNIDDFDKKLDVVEKEFIGFHLSDEQRMAVQTALSNSLTVVTGGPGTGKTAIQKAMIKLYYREHPDKKVTCCAPTGKAARRMTEATEHASSTIHRALGLMADEDGAFADPDVLEGNFIIIDEISMLDNSLADALFRAIRVGAQIVLVGDINQLPSVGAGNVLKDIIDSGVIPVVRLEKVFRQKGDSRIAINASKMKNGNTDMEYGRDFQFFDSPDIATSAIMIADKYEREVRRIGLDNVTVLLPLRRDTDLGVNNLNPVLRDRINPPQDDLPEYSAGKNRLFRKGDKVTQTRNFEDVSNGDMGYITDITERDHDTYITIDFGDNRIKEYDSSEIDMIDLGYALTIHKSQGSEYQSCLIALHNEFGSQMLTRPLIYTAITRGKKAIGIVGERSALEKSIENDHSNERYTGLKDRLQLSMFELLKMEAEIVEKERTKGGT